MFRYYVKLGALSIRRNPALSALMVAAIATGIGACMTIVNIEYVMGTNPIPQRSDVLFYAQLDSWDPNEAAVDVDRPPQQVTYRDGTALLAAQKARRQVLSYVTWRVIEPEDPEQLPFQVQSRSTSADFFPMFDTPFLYGGGWDKSVDDNAEYVVVINKETNAILFGGENSVGRTVVMNGDQYRVSGVLDTWEPMPKFYDLNNQHFGEVEEVFFPFSVSIASELSSNGNTNCWKAPDENSWEAFRDSECVWMQFWVELHGAEEKQEYLMFLDAYAESQKALGRFPRPLNNRLNNVTEWLEIEGVVADDVQVLLGLAVLFLIVCLLNTVGLILAKVMRRSGDISLRRALGASRRTIFVQYIVEAGVIGLVGGVFGIGMTWLGLQGIRGLYGQNRMVDHLVQMDWNMIFVAVCLAIVAALGAALYPTWRACRIQPAAELNTL
jgi:putative ABC transport system permease protein